MATPIGNLEDVTLRALRILREADLVAAEDTRHTRKLLAHYEIKTPLVAYHQHSGAAHVDHLVRRLTENGESIALVTDAGTPGISDPGFDFVTAAIAAGVTVVPLPGASAALTALVASGVPTARWAFEGFLPRTKSSRRAKLTAMAAVETRTVIFYEAGNRTAETLTEMAAAFGGERPAAVGRELTKKHEEFVRGTLASVSAHFNLTPARGEVTIIVGGRDTGGDGSATDAAQIDDLSPEEALEAAFARGLSERDAVREVSLNLKLSRREVYSVMLARKQVDV